MNKLFFLAVFGLLALGSGCSRSQGEVPLPPTASTSSSVTDVSSIPSVSVDAGMFSISLPPGWTFNKLQGIDSYVGEFAGDGVRLTFDYGAYSNPLPETGDPKYAVTYEMIDGRQAKVVVPKVAGEGIVGVYFPDIGGKAQTTKLEVHGEGLGASQQGAVLKAFRSVKFKN